MPDLLRYVCVVLCLLFSKFQIRCKNGVAEHKCSETKIRKHYMKQVQIKKIALFRTPHILDTNQISCLLLISSLGYYYFGPPLYLSDFSKLECPPRTEIDVSGLESFGKPNFLPTIIFGVSARAFQAYFALFVQATLINALFTFLFTIDLRLFPCINPIFKLKWKIGNFGQNSSRWH